MNFKVQGAHAEIAGLFTGLIEANPASPCGHFAQLAQSRFTTSSLSAAGLPDVSDIRALLRLPEIDLCTTDAQKAILKQLLEKIGAYATLLATLPARCGIEERKAADMAAANPAPESRTDSRGLTAQTLLRPGAPGALPLLFRAASDIEGLCDALHRVATELDTTTDTLEPCAVLHALAARVKSLNSVVMSYTDGDDIPVWDAYGAVYASERGNAWAQALEDHPDSLATTDTIEDDFMAGRDLAVDIWLHGEALGNDLSEPEDYNIRAGYRRGRPQHNIALTRVQQVIERPELAEGFASVLTHIATSTAATPNFRKLAKLTYAQMTGIEPQKAPKAAPEPLAA